MSDTARPLLPAAVPLLTRDADCLQIGGVDTTDGLLVSPHPPELAALLRSLDGRRVQRAVLADAAREGLDAEAVTAVLDGLRGYGEALPAPEDAPEVVYRFAEDRPRRPSPYRLAVRARKAAR